MTTYLTTTIPYVNAAPHLGFALEAAQADVLARHARLRGEPVRLISGTDDNSLKNVLAAEAAGLIDPTASPAERIAAVAAFVDANAARFEALASPLSVDYDDFIRTSRDSRHQIGVAALWRACAAAGDLYRDQYEGLYCVGCEHFVTPDELDAAGHCPEHGDPPQHVAQTNWFFRLSRYAERIESAIESGELRVTPAARRNEVLAFVRAGLRDFSVSRSRERARGWGIPVPDDPDQVIYVWWDALGNYVTSLGYGGDTTPLDRWWTGADRRVPVAVVDAYGTDALRWWLLREVPRVGDVDFTIERLDARAREDLAGGFGNLVHRVTTMIHRFRDGYIAEPPPAVPGDAKELTAAYERAPATIDAALADADFRAAVGALVDIVASANRCIEATAPWHVNQQARSGDAEAAQLLDDVLALLVRACRVIGRELAPFLPDAAARITAACSPVAGDTTEPNTAAGRLPVPTKVFDFDR